MRSPVLTLISTALLALQSGAAGAHPGGLDENGCHYDRSNGRYHCHEEAPPNLDRNAAVKKSRDNVCHDKRSPNYHTLRNFVPYQNMDLCLVSGGRPYRGA